jgi:O-antigen/teichoic acid export membrane protein
MLRNTLSNAGGKVLVLAVSFVLTPFVLRALGPTAFGVWVLAQVVVGYGSLLDLGIGASLVRQVAYARARGRDDEAALLAGTSTRIYAVLGAVALVLGSAIGLAASRVVEAGALEHETVFWVYLLVTASFAVNLAGTPAIAALRGLQRFDLCNAVTVAGSLANAGLTVLVLATGGGVVALVAVNLPVAVATQVTAALLLRREDPRFALRWSPASRRTATHLSRSGSSIVTAQVAGLLQKRTSELIVAGALGAAAVTPFSLARRLSDVPNVLSDQFVKVLLPIASELDAGGGREEMKRLYLSSTRITLALMLPAGLVAAFLAGDLLELWVGPEFRSQAPVVVLLVLASIASTSQWPAGAMFQGMGRFGAFAVGALVTGLVSLVLSIVLVRDHGLVGVAVATLVPMTLEALFFVGPFAIRRLGVDVRSLMVTAVLPALVPALACGAVLLVCTWALDTSTWPALLGSAALSTAAYLLGYLAMPGTEGERVALGRLLRSARPGG